METVKLKSSRGTWIMCAAVLTSSMAFIDATALNVVLPSLQKNLEASSGELFWVLNAYLLMLASLMLIGGSLGDRFGHKKIFMLGITVFVLGSAACGLSSSVTQLVLFRLIQGAGGAVMIPGSLSLISSAIVPQERGKAIGIWSSLTTLVTMGGPVLGGALADAGLWRYIFYINIPIGIIALLLLWRHVRESRSENKNEHLDIWGSLTIASALAAITFGVLRSPDPAVSALQTWTFLTIGTILLLSFILIEHKSKKPMMPLALFSDRTFTGANLLTFFLYAGFGSGMLFQSLNLVQAQGYNQLESGMAFLPFASLVLIFAGFAGKLADRYGPRIFLTVGPFTAGIGILLLSLNGQTSGPQEYWTTFFPGMLVFGLGMAFTVAPLTSAVMGAVKPEYSGIASGINNAMTRIANVLAYAILGSVAIFLFTRSLEEKISPMNLSQTERSAVINQAANLGNAEVPSIIKEKEKISISEVYRQSFISSYQIIMRCSAGLIFVGALFSILMIKKQSSVNPLPED